MHFFEENSFMIRLILFLLSGLALFPTSAQLPRKPLLGARIEYVNENGASGCKVLQVIRGTSVELKLQENDIIFKIRDKDFKSLEEFMKSFLDYSPGEEIQLSVLRDKKKLHLKPKQWLVHMKQMITPQSFTTKRITKAVSFG